MSIVPHLALFAWIVVVPLLFTRMSRQRAVLVAVIGGWLFLPVVEDFVVVAGTPAPIKIVFVLVTKINAISYGLVAAVLWFDGKRVQSFRPRWFDLPILAWCICPFLSQLTNTEVIDGREGIRFTTGIMQTIQQTMAWGVPYFVGRLYFDDLASFHELARGIVIGGLVYAPLCLLETRLSPQLHAWTYGYQQHDFSQAIRDGGYRPLVFMAHGLAVGMWLAVWLWWTQALPRLDVGRWRRPLPMGAVALFLLVAVVLIKSAGALALGLAGAGTLFAARWVPLPLAMAGLIAVAPLYIAGRSISGATPTGWTQTSFEDHLQVESLERRALAKPVFGWWPGATGQDFVDFLTKLFNKDRAESFAFRMKQEDKLLEKALRKPIFGWGGEGRARLYNPATGRDESTADGLWIVMLGDRGYFGLAALCLAILLPAIRFTWLHPQRMWAHPAFAPMAAIAVILVIVMIDDLSNAMSNPIFILASGALASVSGCRLPTAGEARSEETARPAAATRRLGQRPPETQQPGVLQRPLPSG